MTKKDILYYLDKYNLDKNEFIIISGAALVLYGIKKETPDIDITTTKKLYNELLKKYNCILEKKCNGSDIYFIDNILNFSKNFYNMVEYKNYLGYNVQTPESIIELKTMLNREKDKKDIKLTKMYIKEHQK